MTSEEASGAIDLGELTDDLIAGSFRLWQRKAGHRFSLDDVATAWEAASARPDAMRALDLGCGIGSVLHMVAHKLPNAQIVGIEAQPISFEMVSRNVARNAGMPERTRLIHGDIREPRVIAEATKDGLFDLVSGTPPYMPLGTSTVSPDPQRAGARVELRGGVEEYLRAASRAVAPNGRIVVCADARTPERVERGAREANLVILRRRDVIPRAVKGALLTVWTCARVDDVPNLPYENAESLVVRDANGARTEQAHALRAFFDIPPNLDEPPSP
jgi:tRNA1Val (adenine37-N6)-methyltransferase